MSENIYDFSTVESFEPQPIDFRNLMTGDHLLLGEFHSSIRSIQAVTAMVPDLAERGYGVFGMEGISVGISYSGEVPIEEFVDKYFSERGRKDVFVKLVTALNDYGIKVVGVDLTKEELGKFREYYQTRFQIAQASLQKAQEDIDQFMKLVPFLLQGIDLEVDMDKLNEAGVLLSAERIKEMATNPLDILGEVDKVTKAMEEIREEIDRTIINRRDELMPQALLEATKTEETKGVLFCGNAHCSSLAPTSAAQRVLREDSSATVAFLVGVPDSEKYLSSLTKPSGDSMFSLGPNHWLVYLREDK